MKTLLFVLLFLTNIAFSGEIIVQFHRNTTNSQINNLLRKEYLTATSETYLSTGRVFLLYSGEDIVSVIDRLRVSELVQYVNINEKRYNVLTYVPNDSLFGWQWGSINLGNNIPSNITGTAGMDIGTDSAWNYTKGSTKVIMAVCDTGVDTLHEDLMANLIPGSGWDFINNQRGAMDDHNHGTSCAGVLGAVGNNTKGISGICPILKIFPVKMVGVVPIPYATEYSCVSAVVYAYQQGAWVSSNSWIWDSIPPSTLLQQAFIDGVTLGRHGKGTVYVAASGNEALHYVYYPARDSNVIGVGAMNPCGERVQSPTCNVANWGSNYDSTLEVVAPGVVNITPGLTSLGKYRLATGTSTACPMVSGVCALMLSIDSSLTYRQVRTVIINNTTKLPTYTYVNGRNEEVGYGLVSAVKSVQAVFYNGDINQDGAIDLTDMLAVYNNMIAFATGIIRTDVNRDLVVDLTDLLQIQGMVK